MGYGVFVVVVERSGGVEEVFWCGCSSSKWWEAGWLRRREAFPSDDAGRGSYYKAMDKRSAQHASIQLLLADVYSDLT